VHFVAAQLAIEEFVARSESAKRFHVRNCTAAASVAESKTGRRCARPTIHFGTIATKSRTGFRPEIENAPPSSRTNQNALEEPPSRFIARRIFESAAIGAVASMSANPESEVSEQKPRKARSFVAIPAKVRRASCESFRPRIRLLPSTRNGPAWIAAVIFSWERIRSRVRRRCRGPTAARFP